MTRLVKFRKALDLPPADWARFLVAWILLWAAEVAIRTLSFDRIPARFPGAPRRRPIGARSATGQAEAAVRRASALHLKGPVCLRSALALRWMLHARGIPAKLVIGVRSEGPRMMAHAWVEYPGLPPLDGAAGTPGFRPLRRAGETA